VYIASVISWMVPLETGSSQVIIDILFSIKTLKCLFPQTCCGNYEISTVPINGEVDAVRIYLLYFCIIFL